MFDACMDQSWIGGLYYIRSIVYQCLESEKITENYRLLVLVNDVSMPLFKNFGNKIIMKQLHADKMKKLFKITYFMKKYKVKWYYNLPFGKQGSLFKKHGIYWIPDFQHLYYPQFFSEEERGKRDEIYSRIANDNRPLVLSSEAAFHDFQTKFPDFKCPVEIVHFVSYIENEIGALSEQFVCTVKHKYHLDSKYFYIPNQFWQHKNHIVILKAIRYCVEHNVLSDYEFVFTGELKDNRNANYFQQLQQLIQQVEVQRRVKILGFLTREEQLAIMKAATLIIQPSLFEGWGTVVEDAKVLDKTIVLSDIPVHHEQKNEKCFLFSPDDEENLIAVIKNALGNCREESVDDGLERMQAEAKQYVKGLENIIID